MRTRGLVGAIVLAGMAGALLPGPAQASCGEFPRLPVALEDARTVFVGTVTEVENARRWVQVDVEDLWKGEAPERVEVRAGPADPPGPMQVASSNDRTYKLGETYLFVLWDTTEPFADSFCSATTRWGPRLAQFDPTPAESDASRGPHPLTGVRQGPGFGENSARWVVVGFSIVVFALAVAVGTRSRGRT